MLPPLITGGVSRSTGCGICNGCKTTIDCGRCKMCLDKPKFGGPGRKKQRCLKRKCTSTKPTNTTQKKKSGRHLKYVTVYVLQKKLPDRSLSSLWTKLCIGITQQKEDVNPNRPSCSTDQIAKQEVYYGQPWKWGLPQYLYQNMKLNFNSLEHYSPFLYLHTT